MAAGFFPPNIGSIERYVVQLSQAMMRRGWQVAVLTSQLHGTSARETFEGMEIFRLPSTFVAGGRFPIPRLGSDTGRAVLDELRRWNPDVYVVHTHLFLICAMTGYMARRQRKPALLIGHGSGYLKVGNRVVTLMLHVYEHMMAWALKKTVRKAFAVSNASANWWRRFSISPAGTLYNAIDARNAPERNAGHRDLLGIPRSATLVAYAARLLPEKGVDVLVRTFMRLALRYPDAYLVVAGSGPALEAMRAEARDQPRIRFLGAVDNRQVLSLFGAADIFAYPSRYPEGLPTCLLEAGAMGCAAVITPMGGTAEVVHDQDHGRIVRDEAEFETAMAELIGDSGLRRRLGENLRRKVLEEFDWDAVAAKLDHELTGLLA